MNAILLKLYVKCQNLFSREDGQDLTEYTLLAALLALATAAASQGVGSCIGTIYNNLSTAVAGI
jgi:Flp pilus assembly pilin Flp